jgi:hypothetical protein
MTADTVTTDDAATIFTDWNLARTRGPDHEYGCVRLTQDLNGVQRLDRGGLAAALRDAADLLDSRHDEPWAMADLWSFLKNADRVMPEIEAWQVIKNYGETDPTSAWYGRKTVWCGCLTREQADAIAEAVEEHYATKYHHLRRERFTVEFGPVGVRDMLHPDTTPRRYVRGLG